MSDTDVKDDRKYSKDHEWVKVEGDLVVVGITDFAQNSLKLVLLWKLITSVGWSSP